MLTFVLNRHGDPLMPCSPRKARILLASKKARVVRRCPFTIRLLHGSSGFKQTIIAGMDVGSKTIGTAAASSGGEVLYQSEVMMRGESIKKKMEQRAMYRRTRGGRKTRYRKPRFLNRRNSTRKGRLPPSVEHKIDMHCKEKMFLESILPVSEWVVELVNFDIHKISNPKVSDYQDGKMKGFYNVKAFVLDRDGHKCRAGGKSCSNKLHVHHVKLKSRGGSDAPDNLITLCEMHHDKLHKGTFKLSKSLKVKDTRAAMHANVVSAYIRRTWDFVETFGYETKHRREAILNLAKTHYNDAVAICTTGETIVHSSIMYLKKCVSSGDYQQTKGRRSEMRIPTGKLFGLRKFDLVETVKGRGFVKGKRATGYFSISTLDGTVISNSANIKKNTTRLSARRTVLVQPMAV